MNDLAMLTRREQNNRFEVIFKFSIISVGGGGTDYNFLKIFSVHKISLKRKNYVNQ